MLKGNPLFIAALFALGVGLLTVGVTSNAETTLWGITFHARLAKGLGLITTLAGIIAFLVMYGSSLPPNQAERRLTATLASRRGEQSREEPRKVWGRPIAESTSDAPRSGVTMRPVRTESRIRVAAEQENSHTLPT